MVCDRVRLLRARPSPPDIGVLRIPRHDFAQDFSDFSFQSHLTKLEVITAIQKIMNENQRVLKVCSPRLEQWSPVPAVMPAPV